MDCLVWLATFLGCLFISIDAGLGMGIALGLLFLFVRTTFSHVHVLRRLDPRSTCFRDAAMYRLQVRTCRHLPVPLAAMLCCCSRSHGLTGYEGMLLFPIGVMQAGNCRINL